MQDQSGLIEENTNNVMWDEVLMVKMENSGKKQSRKVMQNESGRVGDVRLLMRSDHEVSARGQPRLDRRLVHVVGQLELFH